MEEERQAGKVMCGVLKAVVEAREAEEEAGSGKKQKTIEESFENGEDDESSQEEG